MTQAQAQEESVESRVGKRPVPLPAGVDVKISGRVVSVKGPKGTVEREMPSDVKIEIKEKLVKIEPVAGSGRKGKQFQGLARALLAAMVEGASKGFATSLDLIGVGYRAEVKGDEVHFALGYSHPVIYPIPEGIGIEVDKNNRVTVTGADRQRVGQVAAEIRKLRKPDPYKGKGIKYSDEIIRRKVGKAGAK